MHNSVLFPILLSASTFLSYSTLAACTANPDCAALGYTKTSCASGDLIIKCPFDTAKVQCIPQTCETIGKKTCGDNCITGNCCSNADCVAGQRCHNNVCKEVICAVGDIYYNDETCSADLVSGKTPIGVVGKISNGGRNGIVVEKNHSSSTMPWGCVDVDLSCITNIPGTDGGSNPELRADYNGKANTACIVQNNCNYNGTTGAGVYCNSRSVEGVTGWYLPAGGELYDTIIGNYSLVNTGLGKISGATKIPASGQDCWYPSSSTIGNNHAWSWQFEKNRWYASARWSCGADGYVRCVLAF